jgi:hypothetical protein
MTDEKKPEEVSPDELEEQEGEQLPDREVMTILPVGDVLSRPVPLDGTVHPLPPVEETE